MILEFAGIQHPSLGVVPIEAEDGAMLHDLGSGFLPHGQHPAPCVAIPPRRVPK